jgi:hypothetical protein
MNALQFAITMCLKLGKEIKNPFALVNSISDDSRITFELFLFTSNIRKEVCGVLDYFLSISDDSRITFELFLFTSNIRKEVCGVLDYFLSFQRKYEKRKTRNMFFMLHPKAFVWYLLLLAEKKVEIYVMNEYDRRIVTKNKMED